MNYTYSCCIDYTIEGVCSIPVRRRAWEGRGGGREGRRGRGTNPADLVVNVLSCVSTLTDERSLFWNGYSHGEEGEGEGGEVTSMGYSDRSASNCIQSLSIDILPLATLNRKWLLYGSFWIDFSDDHDKRYLNIRIFIQHYLTHPPDSRESTGNWFEISILRYAVKGAM